MIVTVRIDALTAADAAAARPALVALLRDSVDSGASIGFLPPLADAAAEAGWTRAGAIPRYAQSAGRALDASAFYYRLLNGSEEVG